MPRAERLSSPGPAALTAAIGIPDVDGQLLSQGMLTVLDERWKDHLYDLDQLRNAIQYRAWGQKKYKKCHAVRR